MSFSATCHSPLAAADDSASRVAFESRRNSVVRRTPPPPSNRHSAALAGLVALLVYAGCPPRKALAAATRPTRTTAADAASEASEEQDRLLDATTLEPTATTAEGGEVGDLRLARSGWAHAEFWLVLVIFFVNFGCGLMVSVRHCVSFGLDNAR